MFFIILIKQLKKKNANNDCINNVYFSKQDRYINIIFSFQSMTFGTNVETHLQPKM